jgi:hypothetical protein
MQFGGGPGKRYGQTRPEPRGHRKWVVKPFDLGEGSLDSGRI